MSQLVQNAESHELSDAFEKLGLEASRLQTVIDTVPSFLWASFPDGSKEYLNKRWYEYTGLTHEQGKGWGWKVVVHPGDIDRLRGWLALVDTCKPGELETRIRRYGGLKILRFPSVTNKSFRIPIAHPILSLRSFSTISGEWLDRGG
ncbi:MAG: hypothetical protein ABR902_10700 [Candidatus Korobacteraceae bacterium]|jgi:PAS domain-containing protein